MKKLYIALSAMLLTMYSCSMDLDPAGEIQDEDALENVNDYRAFNNGLYAMMRSATSGDFVVLSDIQLDDFHAVIGNGNRRMDFYNGLFNPTTGEVASIYGGYYSIIAQANFLIGKADEALKSDNISESDATSIRYYAGQARFLRAYCYNCLADKFCGSYRNTADLDAPGLGLSLQLTYDPTADNKKFPGRSSMKATYAQICADMEFALAAISEYEEYTKQAPKSGSEFATSDAVKALQARVFLNMGDDKAASDKATEVLKTDRYKLVPNTAFRDLWTKDSGSEIIWLVEADYTYHGSATGAAFASNTMNSDYVPTNDCIYLFDENDIRWTTWFEETKISNSGGEAVMYRFMKYPGNPELYSSLAGSNFVNKAKPLRSSELYLIAAEAFFNQGNAFQANSYINTMLENRISRYRTKTYDGVELMRIIQDERHREMMGEGLRLADLKRWQQGFTRGSVFEGHDNVIINNFKTLEYEAKDHRLVWPIPQHELDANPQISKQQNPGY